MRLAKLNRSRTKIFKRLSVLGRQLAFTQFYYLRKKGRGKYAKSLRQKVIGV